MRASHRQFQMKTKPGLKQRVALKPTTVEEEPSITCADKKLSSLPTIFSEVADGKWRKGKSLRIGLGPKIPWQ
jgi:hypothetical protein